MSGKTDSPLGRTAIQMASDPSGQTWLHAAQPDKILIAKERAEVVPLLEEVDRATQAGYYAVGYISYGAAPALNPYLTSHQNEPGTPYAWFALYKIVLRKSTATVKSASPYALKPLKPSCSSPAYLEAIQAIKTHIEKGETYQVNYSMPMHAEFKGCSETFFKQLLRASHCRHAAYLNMGDMEVCSASPELFYFKKDDRIVMRPMKGTAPRGTHLDHDRSLAEQLQNSPKNRAENIMIVDMIRNDLGKIAQPCSIRAERLFQIETYPTLFQMTSEVSAQSTAPLLEVMQALFPCASITGAPKKQTMEIIQQLEPDPRNIYTGAIGYITPHGETAFSVAIRTATLSNATGQMAYHVGSGIVWDSDPEEELEECKIKARVITRPPRPTPTLLETLYWSIADGYFLKKEHLARLRNAAAYFNYPLLISDADHALEKAITSKITAQRVRLLVEPDGSCRVETADLANEGRNIWTVCPASRPIHSENPLLYNKTTDRSIYERFLKENEGVDDVLLYNEKDEWTESTKANIAFRFGKRWVTPPVSCGLLNGTFRQHLIESGELVEQVVPLSQLFEADEVMLINSVRKWITIKLELPDKK